MRRSLVIVGVAALVAAIPASAAAPNYIMVTGRGLTPVLMRDWAENGAFIGAVTAARRVEPAAAKALAQRPRFRLWLFWAWSNRPPPSKASEANQRGAFYPAYGSRRAVVVLHVSGLSGSRYLARYAPAKALAILRRHGVPTRVRLRPRKNAASTSRATRAEMRRPA